MCDIDEKPSGILTVSPQDSWSFIGELFEGGRSRLWSISSEVRNEFSENVIESWGTVPDESPISEVMSHFRKACASLPQWNESVTRSWNADGTVYAMFSGHAVIADQNIESTSILGIRGLGGQTSAHQVVVTTFADRHDLHLALLRQVQSTGDTNGSIIL